MSQGTACAVQPPGFIPIGSLGWEGLLQVREDSLTLWRECGISPIQLDEFRVSFDCIWKVAGNGEIILEKFSKSEVFILQPTPDLLPGACTISSESQRDWR